MTAVPPPAEPPPVPDPAFGPRSWRSGPPPRPVGPRLPTRIDPNYTEPTWPTSPLDLPSPFTSGEMGPWMTVVRNDDDGPVVRGYLKRFYDHRYQHRDRHRYVLVRPTPGATDRATLALDLLAGLDKNPETVAAEHLGPASWDHARAWLAATEITDLVIDRAHLLGADRLADLASLASWLQCRVWLIWSGGGDLAAATVAARAAKIRPGSCLPEQLSDLLPLPGPAPHRAVPFDDRVLPTAEFTTFRAACRRLLSPREFAHVDQLYLDAAERTDQWFGEHARLREQGVQNFGSPLAAWLRDIHLGPRADAGAALITLRATQAALFIRGVLLRWNPAALGPDSVKALGSTLHLHPHALYAGARTAPAAATALSLHLNVPPLYFGCWRIRDAARNGATLATPSPGGHHHNVPSYVDGDDYRAAIEQTSGVEEIPCAHTVHLPEAAQPILAAHRAYRLLEGASEHDPLFEESRTAMQRTTTRVAEHIHELPPWLHRDPCRQGGDIGANRRTYGWLAEHGLSVHLLDAELAGQLHHPLHHRGEP